MKKFLYALRFMTVIPLPYKQDEDMNDVARSLALFPLIGGLIGLMLWGTALLSGLLLSPLTSGFVVMVISMIITGGLHLDGLSDLADGLGGGQTREKRLEIMKDSRIGAFGALTLIGFLLLKGLFTGELIVSGRLIRLVLPPLWARLFTVLAIRSFPTARPGGMGDFFRKAATLSDIITALVLCLAGTFITGWFSTGSTVGSLSLLAALSGTILLMYIPAGIINKMLNGLTGDCYGALTEGAELLSLLAILVTAGMF